MLKSKPKTYCAAPLLYDRLGLAKTIAETMHGTERDSILISFDPRTPADALFVTQYNLNTVAQNLDDYTRIIVPSNWQRDRIKSLHGFHGFRTSVDLYEPQLDLDTIQVMRRRRGQKLRFLMIASHGDQPRKGADLAKAAFSSAFGDREDVELIIHSTYPAPDLVKNAANINIRGGKMQGEEYWNYLAGFDAMLNVSRAEVYGMTVHEAIASGMPVIHTGATGMERFSGKSLHVRHRGIRCADGTEWREAFIDEVVDRLREVDTQYASTMKQAQTEAKALRKSSEEKTHGDSPQSSDVSSSCDISGDSERPQ